MKVIVLAAGYGTRLYPLTLDTPKPLILIAGTPLIEHILYRILEIPSINEIIIVTNDKFFSNFIKWSNSYKSNIPIRILNDGTKSNEDRLGAVGDIDFAIKNLDIDEDVLVVAGDNLFEFSLQDLFEFFNKKKSSVVALYDLKEKKLLSGKYGVASVSDDFKIIDFEEKPKEPKSSLASTACYFFTRKDIASLEQCLKEKNPDNLGDFVKWITKRNHVYGFVFSEKWFDIGSHDQLKEADEHWSAK